MSLLKKNLQVRWFGMAVIDIFLVSFSIPLSVLAGIKWDRGESLTFWLLMFGVMFINAVSMGFSWLISWLIYTKKE